MKKHAQEILVASETLAAAGSPVSAILSRLRQLSLDDFGLFFISLPNSDYPSLSAALPAMASSDIQRRWTGGADYKLFIETSAFVRQLENNFARYNKAPLFGASILDFGCGYGRHIRMMYYYTNPENIWGVDAWEKSLQFCRDSRLLGSFARSDPAPARLPVGDTKFDLAYSFSIFTHLPRSTAEACLSAVRAAMKPGGLYVATVRPPEYWALHDTQSGTNVAESMVSDHEAKGFAYLPHGGAEGEHYGNSSIPLSFFERDGWELLGYDSCVIDGHQISAILRAC